MTGSPRLASPMAVVDVRATFSSRPGDNRFTTPSGHSSRSADVRFRLAPRRRREGVVEGIVDRIGDRRSVSPPAPAPPSKCGAPLRRQRRTSPQNRRPARRRPKPRRLSICRRSSPTWARRRIRGFDLKARSFLTPRPCRIPKPWRAKLATTFSPISEPSHCISLKGRSDLRTSARTSTSERRPAAAARCARS